MVYSWDEYNKFGCGARKIPPKFSCGVYCLGILRDYSGKGIGTAFFKNVDQWAIQHGVHRLELPVECRNYAARHLYEKSGFQIEGTREKSMLVEGSFVDEYFMAKIL